MKKHIRTIFAFTNIFKTIKLLFLLFNIIIIFLEFTDKLNKDLKDDNPLFQNYILKNENPKCDEYEPIHLLNLRINNGPKIICQNEKSKSRHICYQNDNGKYNDIFWHTNGVFCTMENIILDPSKSQQSGLIYKGPVDPKNQGFPLLSKGFYNMNCQNRTKISANSIYNNYFEAWNYDYDYDQEINKEENIEELAPGKTILFLSRNQDSPNLFHGNSEFINALSILYLFKINPKNVRIIFLESLDIKQDPFYDLYKDIISRGGAPLYIRDLKKKYHISSAIHVPINWDSPCFLKRGVVQSCNNPTLTYKIYNDLVNKYFEVSDFIDPFISNDIFYYPKSIIENKEANIKFNKTITIQWRQVWPKGRNNQYRILGNGPELADKLASILPKNILVRLVETAGLPMKEQIGLMKKTDYLVGIHGAGLSLSIFLPYNSILHEVCPSLYMAVLRLMSVLSGHKTYSDIIKARVEKIKEIETVFFDADAFSNSVYNHLKENNFF